MLLVVAFDHHHTPIGQVLAFAPPDDHDPGSAAVVRSSGEIVELQNVEVGTYELPQGITYAEWEAHQVEFRIMSASGLSTNCPAAYWRTLATMGLGPVRLWATVKMVEYPGRSTFWMSLRDQILNWLETAPAQRRWATPLSKKQWETALADPEHMLKGKQLCDDLAAGGDMHPLREAMLGRLGDTLVRPAGAEEERVFHGA
jgi:hypothetical protein